MEKTIASTINHLTDALNRMKTDAWSEIIGAGTIDGEMEVFWKYAKTILEISEILEKAGYKA